MSTPLLPPSNQICKTSTMENLKATISSLANSHSHTPFTPSQIALLQKKLVLAFPVFYTPTHPTYTVMIENAINKLDEVDGSSEESISKYIQANYDGLPWAHAKYLSHHLNKLCEDGEIVLNSTSKRYNIPARPVVKDYNLRAKQPTRVRFVRKRKECGVDLLEEGENNVIAARGNLIGLQEEDTMMSEKCETKRRRRSLVLEDDDSEVGGKPNVGYGEQNNMVVERPDEAVALSNGDDLLKEGNEHNIVTAIEDDPSTVGILDRISECEGTVNGEKMDEDNISATELMVVPVKSVGNSFSTLCCGIEDNELVVEDLDLKEHQLMNVPFDGNTGISAASSGINEFAKSEWPIIVCALEESSKHNLVCSSKQTLKDRKTTKKVSSASLQKRSKVNQVNKKVSKSMTSSSALAVEHDQIHDRLLSQRGLETKLFATLQQSPLFMELPVDRNQQACGMEGGYVEQLERPEYSEDPAKMKTVIVPDLLVPLKERLSTLKANLIAAETGSILCRSDNLTCELETDRGLLFHNVGSSGNVQNAQEKQQNQSKPESLSEQYLQNLEHHKEDQERQGCENNFRFEDLEAPPVVTFAEDNRPISYPNRDQELKIKLQERLRKRFEARKKNSEALRPQNREQNNKELKKGGLVSHRIQLKKSGEGRLWKCIEVAKEDITLSSLHHQPQEVLFEPTIERHAEKDGRGRMWKNLDAMKEHEEVSVDLFLERQEESSELVMSENSLQQVKWLEKEGRQRLQKPLESPSVQQINRLEKEDRERSGKPIEATKEDLVASKHLHLLENKQRKKVGRGRPRKQKQAKEDSASLSVPLNVAQELEEGLPDQEKEHKYKVCEHKVTQEEYKCGAGLPKKNGRGRPRKNKDPAASKNLDLQEIKQVKKGRGRPRKQTQVNKKDSAGLSDPLNVVHKLEEGLPDQENELRAKVHEQLKIEALKPNLSNGSHVKPVKPQNEVSICETQLAVPPADIDEKGNQLVQKQEELLYCHEHKVNEGEFEDQAELPKVESEKVTMSSKYPLRSRVNHQSHVPLSSKDQLRSRINGQSQ